MNQVLGGKLPSEAVAVRLCRIASNDRLILCEPIRFNGGASAIDTVLRRAEISGRVVIGGVLEDYFADILNDEGDMIENVALDRRSYAALKNRWMRCRVQRDG